MRLSAFTLCSLLLIATSRLLAQHEAHMMMPPAPADTTKKQQNMDAATSSSHAHDSGMHIQMNMSHALSGNLPMTRNGSGTSWNPDESPMYVYMMHKGDWMFMFMGDIFLRYDNQDIYTAGRRGGEKVDLPDMLMASAQRQLGRKGLLHFNLMMSAEALVAGGSGYPLLLQTGESWHGQPLVDRQHPHDLFSELSASYSHSFTKQVDAYAYVGYPGEPALGPTTFMHRPLANFMPDAPIGHHWQDATHITYGVATAGVRVGMFKLEGSSFTGREPDENRYNFDKPLFDSWSGRLWFAPSSHWALQVSRGYIKSPEALHPNEDIYRNTASATYSTKIGCGNYFAATALWGQNNISGQQPSNSELIEAVFKMPKSAVYVRGEKVEKTAEELALLVSEDQLYTVYTNYVGTFGFAYDMVTIAHTTVAAGAQLAFYSPDRNIRYLYGNHPTSAEFYLHFYPALLQHK